MEISVDRASKRKVLFSPGSPKTLMVLADTYSYAGSTIIAESLPATLAWYDTLCTLFPSESFATSGSWEGIPGNSKTGSFKRPNVVGRVAVVLTRGLLKVNTPMQSNTFSV